MNDRPSVRIHPTAEVAPEAEIGDGTSIWNQAQVRARARIGAGCTIGKNVYVDTDVVIGSTNSGNVTLSNDALGMGGQGTAEIAKGAKVVARFGTTRKGAQPTSLTAPRTYTLEVTPYRAALIELAKGMGENSKAKENNFTLQGSKELGVEVSFGELARICLVENDARLAPYDPRLLRPRMVSGAIRLVLRFMKGPKSR